MKRVIFDIDTEPFCSNFENVTSIKSLVKYAPRMRIACLYDESSNRYYYFDETNISELISKIQSADEVITFNGKGFDLPVLRRHFNLKGRVPLKGKHFDLAYEIDQKKRGFRISLHRLCLYNFGEGKLTDVSNKQLSRAEECRYLCRSDVDNTYKLWKLWVKGDLILYKTNSPFYEEIITNHGNENSHKGGLPNTEKALFKRTAQIR